VAYAALYK